MEEWKFLGSFLRIECDIKPYIAFKLANESLYHYNTTSGVFLLQNLFIKTSSPSKPLHQNLLISSLNLLENSFNSLVLKSSLFSTIENNENKIIIMDNYYYLVYKENMSQIIAIWYIILIMMMNILILECRSGGSNPSGKTFPCIPILYILIIYIYTS